MSKLWKSPHIAQNVLRVKEGNMFVKQVLYISTTSNSKDYSYLLGIEVLVMTIECLGQEKNGLRVLNHTDHPRVKDKRQT